MAALTKNYDIASFAWTAISTAEQTVLAPPAGKRWSPLDLGSDLLAWWDASQGVATSGSAVTGWTDRKNGYNPTQGFGASRPAFSANGFGGGPCIVTDGADDYLELAVSPFPTGSVGTEFWIVCQSTAADAVTRAVFGYGSGVFTRAVQRTTTNKAQGAGSDGSILRTATTAEDVPANRCLLRFRCTPTLLAMSIDGGPETTNAAVPNSNNTRVRIGCAPISSANFFHMGSIAHIAVTNLLAPAKGASTQTFFLKERRL